MPHSARDLMWSAALVRLARTELPDRQAFRPTQVGWEPLIDVMETQAGLIVVVALPGVRSDDVEILLRRDDLVVRGMRHWPVQTRPLAVHRVELPYGLFERRLPLPPGAFQLAGHDHSDGCLRLTLRRIG